eukprot:TRINITY_DN186_c0_g1_i1.p1 TRINITY_DN186_c0_g1~~TRINITY_DN186_c0_g1_i1.p1  ORF type:complete len:234 (-),score=109.56 TRINITY_DN186_c0_g1_i1:26-685(-)
MSTTTEQPAEWTPQQLEQATKKEMIEFLQKHSSTKFLRENKIFGKVQNVAKTSSKEDLVAAYHNLFATKAFRNEEEEQNEANKAQEKKPEEKKAEGQEEKKEQAVAEKPKYTKTINKNGEKGRTPAKGDLVSCFYTGRLEDGTVFDTNVGKKKAEPLKFKVGTGKVIRGWDEALLTMTKGEKATLTIQSEWAYGKKGLPEAKIPPNATLIFDVELVNID